MQAVLTLFLMCLAVVVDHSSAQYGGGYWRSRCDPCSSKRCPLKGQKCFLMPEPLCTANCSVIPICLIDPFYDPCSIGEPMADASGKHFTCNAQSSCPPGGVCITSNVGSFTVSKCCLDPNKCSVKVKAGWCPFSLDTTTCSSTCTDDGDCPTQMKCCPTACFGKKCTAPFG